MSNIFRNSEDASKLAKMFVEAAEKVTGCGDRHTLTVAMVEALCRALIALYPERGSHGKDILDTIAPWVAKFPRPEGWPEEGGNSGDTTFTN